MIPIIRKGYDGEYILQHEQSLVPAVIGEIVTSGKGESYKLTGGAAPHKSSSQGKVYVHQCDDTEGGGDDIYYASVFDLVWTQIGGGERQFPPSEVEEEIEPGAIQVIAIGPHVWGRGDNIKEAVAQMRKAGFSGRLTQKNHALFIVPKGAYVNEMGGINYDPRYAVKPQQIQ